MSIFKDKEIDEINNNEENESSSPVTIDFWEDIDTAETPKERMKRYYNELAISHNYKNIEHFYVSKKFELAMKKEFDKADDYMNNLLKTIAQDMWYSQSSREYIMQNNLPSTSWRNLIWQ